MTDVEEKLNIAVGEWNAVKEILSLDRSSLEQRAARLSKSVSQFRLLNDIRTGKLAVFRTDTGQRIYPSFS